MLTTVGANKQASCTPQSSSVPAGTHTFTAHYSGAATGTVTFNASSSTSPSITLAEPPPANNNTGNNSEASPVQIDVFYVHPDHLGTPRVVTNPQNNQRVWAWESTPFGESAPNENPQNVTGAGLPAAQFRYNLRFPGQFYDAESGRHYNYFRDYDASIGRYSESDPIGLEGGINTFAYVAGSPLGNVDAFGLCSCVVSNSSDKGHKEKDSKSNAQYKSWWQGELKTIICTYKCTCKCKNGVEKTELVVGTHTESYGAMYSDRGNEGDCIGAVFVETKVFNSKKLTTETRYGRVRYDSFDPRASGAQELREWGGKNCEK